LLLPLSATSLRRETSRLTAKKSSTSPRELVFLSLWDENNGIILSGTKMLRAKFKALK
jgi:hypothetical protein